MSATTDLEVLKSLDVLEGLITSGIEKAEALHQDLLNKDTFKQLSVELSQARKELQESRNVLITSQQISKRESELLQLAVAEASAQQSSLAKSGSDSRQLHLELAEKNECGQACLSSLTSAIQRARQADSQVDASIRRIEAAGEALSEVDRKYQEIFQMKAQIVAIAGQMGDYGSFEALILSLKNATHKLEQEQAFSQVSLQNALEPIHRRVNHLITVQRKPWWWPSNWWWKTRVSPTARYMLPSQDRTTPLA